MRCIDYFVFFNDTATTEIYTLSLHDALPISPARPSRDPKVSGGWLRTRASRRALRQPFQYELDVDARAAEHGRSEEHTSELQSRQYLVCRLLLEKKKNKKMHPDRTQDRYNTI